MKSVIARDPDIPLKQQVLFEINFQRVEAASLQVNAYETALSTQAHHLPYRKVSAYIRGCQILNYYCAKYQ